VYVFQDRDGLKSLKESYEQEMEGIISVALKDRIKELEGLIVDYEKVISEDPSKNRSCEECENRMSMISNLRSESVLKSIKNIFKLDT